MRGKIGIREENGLELTVLVVRRRAIMKFGLCMGNELRLDSSAGESAPNLYEIR